jgi:hypothetical protein
VINACGPFRTLIKLMFMTKEFVIIRFNVFIDLAIILLELAQSGKLKR